MNNKHSVYILYITEALKTLENTKINKEMLKRRIVLKELPSQMSVIYIHIF